MLNTINNDNHGNIYIHLYIFTAIVKYLTRVEYLSNCCVTKESIGFSSKKKRNKYEVYFISGNLLKKIKNCFTGLLPAILTIQASNNYLVLMVRI